MDVTWDQFVFRMKAYKYIVNITFSCEQKRYDIVSFCSRVTKKNRSTFRTCSCLVSTGDTKLVSMTTSDVEVEIGPNCTSLILLIVSSF